MVSAAGEHPGLRRTRRRLPAALRLGDGVRWLEVELLDVSLSGARLRRPQRWSAPQGALRCELCAGEGEWLELGAELVREGDDELAIRFVALPEAMARRLEGLLERQGRLLQPLDGSD